MDKKAETCGQKSEKIVDKDKERLVNKLARELRHVDKVVETCGQGRGDFEHPD